MHFARPIRAETEKATRSATFNLIWNIYVRFHHLAFSETTRSQFNTAVVFRFQTDSSRTCWDLLIYSSVLMTSQSSSWNACIKHAVSCKVRKSDHESVQADPWWSWVILAFCYLTIPLHVCRHLYASCNTSPAAQILHDPSLITLKNRLSWWKNRSRIFVVIIYNKGRGGDQQLEFQKDEIPENSKFFKASQPVRLKSDQVTNKSWYLRKLT